jgi:putative ABC transport system substrate-binding protein
MRRRQFVRDGLAISAVTGISGMPAAARDIAGTARVAWLAGSAGPLPTPAYLEALRAGLRNWRWAEGRNLTIEARWGQPDDAERLASELLASRPDVLVAQGAMVLGVRHLDTGVPIVFGFSGDPVEAKLVRSFSHPGGHLTGIAMQRLDLVGKRLELLKEILPSLARVAVLANPAHPGEPLELRASRLAAEKLGIAISYFAVSSARDFATAWPALLQARAEAIVAFPDALVMSQAGAIASFARHHRIPAASGWSEFADEGNLLTYGPNLRDTWEQAAGFVDRILRGAHPADLPVEQPSRFELVVNQRTAAELGLALPAVISMRTDRMIR